MKRILAVVVTAFGLSGCTNGFVQFPVTENAQKSLPENVSVIRLDSQNIAQFAEARTEAGTDRVSESQVWNYLVGVGDVLNITVFDHPELEIPSAGESSKLAAGFRVQANGTIYYPFVGEVKALGRTPDHVRGDLTEQLKEFIPDPQVQVRVAEYNSQSVIVSGEVDTPNTQMLTATPLTALAAINAAGGAAEGGDLGHVKLQRRGRTYNLNLDRFLAGNSGSHNPILVGGDVISVPRETVLEAYVLGQIGKPSPVDLTDEKVNLTQAIARLGGIDERRADARGVFVFRRGPAPDGITVFQLEASSPAGMLLGTEFYLSPNDVVYVTRAPVSKWNDVITQVLPSVGIGRSVDDIVN